MFRSLQLQFITGLISLVLIVFFQVYQTNENQKRFIDNQDVISRSVDTLSLVHDLERNVIELQRNVLIYTETGSSSVASQFDNIMSHVNDRLDQYETLIKKTPDNQAHQDLITRMRNHLNDYKNNFAEVIEGRNQREILFSQNIYRKILEIITLDDQIKKSNDTLKTHYHLIKAQNIALQYFVLADSQHIANFNRELKIIDSLLQHNSNTKNANTRKKIATIKTDFAKLTNLTRGHIFLINVVMAGSANEFLFLTKEISHLVKKQQSTTSSKILTDALQTQDRSNLAAIVSIFVALIAVFFLSARIILPIRQITTVFIELSKGNNLNEIPALKRQDEIGALARAGHIFQNKNKETSELLEQSQKMNERLETLTQEAQQASRAKGDFLATMSHEIRTPMNGVMGMLRLLERTPLNEKQQHYATIAKSSAEALLVVINDILDFSKIEAGKIELEMLDFNLSNHLTECIEASAFQADEKGIELILDISKVVPPFVKGDPGRIRQILNNLLGNAIKFTMQGEVLVTASLTEQNNGWLFRCAIKDTGIGISKENLATLFDSFTQADNSTTRKYGGTGLGLAISKQLCELMGGELIVSSEIDQGSCFEFTLQLEKSSTTIEQPTIDLENVNIVIVDDNQTNREVLRGQLESWGANVIEADSPNAALLLFDSQHESFSLAIIDMQMPLMSGADLGRAIRKNPAYDPIGLVMMTSVSTIGDSQFFFDIGFDGYLVKPAKPTDLHDAIAVAMNRDKQLKNSEKPVLAPISTQTSPANKSTQRILLVDDNRINLEVALGMLEDLGYLADAANNGQEAIKALANAPADAPYKLILMDCQMPVMDGYEATQIIRRGENAIPDKDIPIIAITANAMQGDKEKCLQAGMNDYLSKPLEEELLLKKLSRWLSEPKDQNTDKNTSPALTQEQEQEQEHPKHTIIAWDKTEALARIGANLDRLQRLLTLFPLETKAYLATIEESANTNDLSMLASACHSLKGVAANLSAHSLSQISGDLEQAAKNNQLNTIKQLLPLLGDSYNKLLSEFEFELSQD